MNKKEVKQFLKQHNFQPVKKFGQHFLINQSIIQNILKKIQKHPPPFVEIGPGLGALTHYFKNKKKDIVLIERDKKLAAYWKKAGYSVFCADALRFKWETLPKIFTLFGNLPYEISASLIVKACLHQKQIQSMLLMMQKEMAQRATAQVRSKNYSSFSVISQIFWNIRPVADVPKTNFYPIPKVDGRVLEFQIKKNKWNVPADSFSTFVKKCFSLKRKMLFKQIDTFSPEKAKKILSQLGICETCRAEELQPYQFIDLYFQMKNKISLHTDSRFITRK